MPHLQLEGLRARNSFFPRFRGPFLKWRATGLPVGGVDDDMVLVYDMGDGQCYVFVYVDDDPTPAPNPYPTLLAVMQLPRRTCASNYILHVLGPYAVSSCYGHEMRLNADSDRHIDAHSSVDAHLHAASAAKPAASGAWGMSTLPAGMAPPTHAPAKTATAPPWNSSRHPHTSAPKGECRTASRGGVEADTDPRSVGGGVSCAASAATSPPPADSGCAVAPAAQRPRPRAAKARSAQP
eukprot:scaffold528_cov126-Isochrysis_galbana.AAC.4